jgi:hypothetical protein
MRKEEGEGRKQEEAGRRRKKEEGGRRRKEEEGGRRKEEEDQELTQEATSATTKACLAPSINPARSRLEVLTFTNIIFWSICKTPLFSLLPPLFVFSLPSLLPPSCSHSSLLASLLTSHSSLLAPLALLLLSSVSLLASRSSLPPLSPSLLMFTRRLKGTELGGGCLNFRKINVLEVW